MKTDDSKKSTTSKKVFDVARPGQTPASATSRPVIASRKRVKDQDVSASQPKEPNISSATDATDATDVAAADTESRSSLMDSKRKITVQPLDPSLAEEAKGEADKAVSSGAADSNSATKQPAETATGSAAQVKPSADTFKVNVSAGGAAKVGQPEASGSEVGDTKDDPPAAQPQPSTDNTDNKASATKLVAAKSPAPPAEVTANESSELRQEEVPNLGSAAVDGTKAADVAEEDAAQESAVEESLGGSAKNPDEPDHLEVPKDFSPSKIVVSHHRKHRTLWLEALAVFVIVLLLAAIANVLLDAGIIATDLPIPHTDFLQR